MRRVRLVFALLALALFAIACCISCGRGGKNGGVMGRLSNPTEPSQHSRFEQPPARTLSIEEAIAEVQAYEPPGDAAAQMNWHVFAQLKYELIRQLEEIATSRGISRFPARDASQSGGGAQITIGDIFVTPTMNGENAITWNETLAGDFDGNGEVGVADITPIATNYLKTYGEGYGNLANEDADRFLKGIGM